MWEIVEAYNVIEHGLNDKFKCLELIINTMIPYLLYYRVLK